MATAKVSNKLTKVSETFTVNMYDNGYMIEVGGRDNDDEWKTSKIMVTSIDELVTVIKEVITMARCE